MFLGQINLRNVQSMFSLSFIIYITSMYIMGDPVSMKSFNFDGLGHCLIKRIYICSGNSESTVKNIKV